MSYQSALQTLQWSSHIDLENGVIHEDCLDFEPSQDLINRIKKDWKKFKEQTLEIGFNPIEHRKTIFDSHSSQYIWDCVAHDFILTRNGHGAGFWDGDWHEPMATKLTELCKKFGEIDTYLSDENLLEAY